MKKSKTVLNKYILLLILILLITPTVEAEFYRSNLEAFTKSKHMLTVPILSPQKLIKIKTDSEAVFKIVGSDNLELKKGQNYYLSQAKYKAIKAQKSSLESKTAQKDLKSGWGVQLMASSSRENALLFKKELAEEIDLQIFILEEDGLFKVLAGRFEERELAEKLAEKLGKMGHKGWTREAETINTETDGADTEEHKSEVFRIDTEEIDDPDKEGLSLYNQKGEKLAEAYFLKIEGKFQVEEKKLEGEYQFGPLGNSVLFSYKSNLEELTAYLLQNKFDLNAPLESLKAQAVLYRTALLYQIEIQGARLENLKEIEFKKLKIPVLKAVEETKFEVLIRNNEFFYHSDYSFREITKPRSGIVSLAKANYNYQEIINYYYERAELANLNDLLDSEIKYNARIESGLHLKEIRQVKWSGPRVITVLDYDLNSPRLKLKPVLAQGIVPGREDLADLIKNNSALAGVNGGYFDSSGYPLGLIYINGQLVSEPLYNRSSLLITKENQISFAQVSWQGSLQLNGKTIKIDGVNRKGGADELILFNHYYGAKTRPLRDQYADIVIRDNKILGLETKAGVETPIPPDGFVLRTTRVKADLIAAFRKNKAARVELNYQFTPNFEENNILHGIGAGPRILKNSKIDINGKEENFQNDILFGRAPRTAVGLTEDGHLLILTIDGRQSELSVGMTLEETARTLKNLGAVDAINFDGGGSARMVIRGFTMSNPSEKRLISNGVLINQDNN